MAEIVGKKVFWNLLTHFSWYQSLKKAMGKKTHDHWRPSKVFATAIQQILLYVRVYSTCTAALSLAIVSDIVYVVTSYSHGLLSSPAAAWCSAIYRVELISHFTLLVLLLFLFLLLPILLYWSKFLFPIFFLIWLGCRASSSSFTEKTFFLSFLKILFFFHFDYNFV